MNKTKYPEVERMLRKYRDSFYNIEDLHKERKAKEEARSEVSTLQANRITDMPHGTDVCNPVESLYIHEIERYDEEIAEIAEQIKELERLQKFVDIKLKQMGAVEQAIIRWKYRERLPEKMILYKLKKEMGYPIGSWQLYNVINQIYCLLK